MKQTLIFGNIITIDDKRPFAKAALVKNGVFAYIGSAEEAKRLAAADTRHNVKEAITREQSLRALTINVAHAWHQEHRLGSIVDGKEVYKA